MTRKIIRKRIMFYVQHLLGTGHLHRAARLSRQLQDAGLSVTIVSGGMPTALGDLHGAELVQLDAARATDAAFSHMLDQSGAPVDDAWRARRKTALLNLFGQYAPDALLIEMFPFGRRQFAFELLPLLEAARAIRPAPLIACSLRDIIVPSVKAGRSEEAILRADSFFDHILVHGDARFLRLEDSYPPAARLKTPVFYTGYVTDTASSVQPGNAGANEVLVSAGGGAVGSALMHTALKARALSAQAGRLTWRLLIGANAPAGELQALQVRAPEGVIVEAARSDFSVMMRACACSVSQAGYNTVMDILQAKTHHNTPAVLVPFTTPSEIEQTIRANALARAGLAVKLSADALSADALAAAVDQAMLQKPVSAALPGMDGGAATARFLTERLNA